MMTGILSSWRRIPLQTKFPLSTLPTWKAHVNALRGHMARVSKMAWICLDNYEVSIESGVRTTAIASLTRPLPPLHLGTLNRSSTDSLRPAYPTVRFPHHHQLLVKDGEQVISGCYDRVVGSEEYEGPFEE